VTETILVFPAGLPESLRFSAESEARGARVIGASSLAFDAAAGAYGAWENLPYVHEENFAEALGAVVQRLGVQAVYSPHEVVAGVLADVMGTVAPGVRLIAPNPVKAEERAYAERYRRAEQADEALWFTLEGGAPPLTPIERAGLVRLVDTIPGMTDLDKMAAVIEAMRHTPPGDLVEIGSWWGRSAALFTLLARRYGVGKVLCVDPWRSDCLEQGVAVLDHASARLDTDQALRIFQINLSPIAGGDLNYLRATSVDGAARYVPGLEVDTETFGRTCYEGAIAFLHIDGNHAYDNVAADAAAWTPHVKPGGWIVFDDYVWAFGDGPKRVGDAYVEANTDRIDLCFVIGTALFVKLKP
jgi:hypothetical protein